MKRIKNIFLGLSLIIGVAFLTKPTDKKCLNETLERLIGETKSGNSSKDSIITIIILGNIPKRLDVQDFFVYKKVAYKSFKLIQGGSLTESNTKVALALFGNVFIQKKGLKEIIYVNGF